MTGLGGSLSLSPLQKKLDGGLYPDVEAFSADLRLIWGNCYTYNKDPNSDVCVMCRELEQLAEARLARERDALVAEHLQWAVERLRRLQP